MSDEGKPLIVAPMEDDTSDTAVAPQDRTPQRRGIGLLLRLGAGVILIGVLLLGVTLLLFERRIDTPDWLRAEVESRIERQLGGLELELGGIEFIVHKGLRPRILFRDVALSYPDGTRALEVSRAETLLSGRSLMRGEFRPKEISLSGILAALQRDSEAFALSLSAGAGTTQEAQSFPELMESGDQKLELPILSKLRKLDVQAVTLRYEDLRQGRGWTLDGGNISVARRGQSVDLQANFSVLSGRDFASTAAASYVSDIGDEAAEFSVVFEQVPSADVASQSVALGWLSLLDAPISGALRGGVNALGELQPLTATLDIGEGVIQPSAELKPVPLSSARSYFTYDPAAQSLEFSELSIESGWLSGKMLGRADLIGVENGRLTDLVGQLQVTDLSMNPFEFYEEELRFSGVSADFSMTLEPFHVRLGEMLVQTDDTDVVVRGDLRGSATGWNYELFASAEALNIDLVKRFWPPSAPPKPREWVRENVLSGDIRDAQVAIVGRETQKPFVSIEAGYEKAEIRYLRTMPILTEAAGHFSLYGHRMAVTATEGHVVADDGGAVDVSGTSFIIPDTRLKGDTALGVLRARAKGSITAALSLLNRPPLSLLDKAELPVDLSNGTATVGANATIPLIKDVPIERVEYSYRGVLDGVTTEKLAPGYLLAAEGLSLVGDNDHVAIEGTAELAGVPLDGRWQLVFGKGGALPDSYVEGVAALSREGLAGFGVTLPDGVMSGATDATFRMELPDGLPPHLSVESSLQGLGLRIAELGWRKAADRSGELKIEMDLDGSNKLSLFEIEAVGLSARGEITSTPTGGLERARFNRVSVGRWLNGAVDLIGRGVTSPPAIRMSSGEIDLRNAPFSSKGSAAGSSGGQNTPITLALDRLRVTDSISLTGFNGEFNTQGGFNGKFDGQLNGATSVNGVVVPQQNGMAMRLRSADAGGVFRSAGIVRHGRGGSFEMTMIPMPEAGQYNGQVRIKDIRVKDAPAIAALVNSISVVGLLNELAGDGIYFSGVDADFTLGPKYLEIKRASAVGPSLGMSLEGFFNLNNGALDMRGVISPIYMLNAIGSVVTRKGEGLFGFSYRLRGTSDDPRVGVNPLSALAPGFVRELFRGRAPEAPTE